MEHTIQVNNRIKELFRIHKVFVQDDQEFNFFSGDLHFDDSLRIEPYTEFIATNGYLCSMGTSSTAGFNVFPANTQIGRFCSIAPHIQIFPPSNHITSRFTTSAISDFGKDTVRDSSGKRYGNIPLSVFEENEGFNPVPTTDKKGWEMDPVVIGHDVWIGTDVWLKPGVHIGNGAVIGLGSIVTKNVEPYSIVAGNPAVPRRKRFSDSIIEHLEQLAWWQYPYWKLNGVSGDMPIENFIERVEKLLSEGKLQPYKPEPLTAQMLLNAAD